MMEMILDSFASVPRLFLFGLVYTLFSHYHIAITFQFHNTSTDILCYWLIYTTFMFHNASADMLGCSLITGTSKSYYITSGFTK